MRLHKLVRRSFTMVELMAAMAIIAILAGIGVKGMQFANQAAAEGATKANMERVKVVLEDFKKLKGYYPQQNTLPVSGTADHQLSIELKDNTKANYLKSSTADPELYDVIPNYTDLVNSGVMERSTSDESTSGADDGKDSIKFVDGYGSYFYYQCPGNYNPKSYDLISAGSDGFFEYAIGADDTQSTAKGNNYYDTSKDQGNVDNMTNWQ